MSENFQHQIPLSILRDIDFLGIQNKLYMAGLEYIYDRLMINQSSFQLKQYTPIISVMAAWRRNA